MGTVRVPNSGFEITIRKWELEPGAFSVSVSLDGRSGGVGYLLDCPVSCLLRGAFTQELQLKHSKLVSSIGRWRRFETENSLLALAMLTLGVK
jgi:hypothetical protein